MRENTGRVAGAGATAKGTATATPPPTPQPVRKEKTSTTEKKTEEGTPNHSGVCNWQSEVWAAQCGLCSKWRVIPTQEEYEEIRRTFTDDPFTCKKLPEISCSDPSDLEYNSERLWAMDKPNLPKTPPGFKRLLIMRKDYSKMDCYYVTPTGKRLRTPTEMAAFLEKHSDYKVSNEDFSFSAPRIMPDTHPGKVEATKKGHTLPGDAATEKGHRLPGDAATEKGHTLPGDAANKKGHTLPRDAANKKGHTLPGDAATKKGHTLTGYAATKKGHTLPGDAATKKGHTLPGDAATKKGHTLPGDATTKKGHGHTLPGDAASKKGSGLRLFVKLKNPS